MQIWPTEALHRTFKKNYRQKLNRKNNKLDYKEEPFRFDKLLIPNHSIFL